MLLNLRNKYSNLPIDEKANVISHGLGLGFALLFSPFLIFSEPHSLQFIGLCIFCFGMCFMFFSSTMYHLANIDHLKNLWNIVDHISIFILIGCTYTPFILYYYNDENGFNFLGLHWTIIISGILFKLIFKTKYEIFSLLLYLILGWMVLFIIKPITENMSPIVQFWLFAGGISYSIGVYFFVKTKLIWHHAIWHIFVILGCAAHFIALLYS
jgi:hemolysin III